MFYFSALYNMFHVYYISIFHFLCSIHCMNIQKYPDICKMKKNQQKKTMKPNFSLCIHKQKLL